MDTILDAATLPAAVFATAFLVTGAVFILKKKNGTGPGKRCPACYPALPIVGSLPFIKSELDDWAKEFLKISKKLGPVFSFYSGSKYVVVMNRKAVFDSLLRKSEAYADRPVFWNEIREVNPERKGIAFAPYTEIWKTYHKLFLSIMKEFGFGVTRESDVRIWNQIERTIEKIRAHNGQPFDPKKTILHSTANVMMTILFGDEFQKQEYHIHQIIKNANRWIGNMDPIIDVLPFLSILPKFRKKINESKIGHKELLASLEAAIEHNKSGDSSDTSFVRRFLEVIGPQYKHEELLYMLRDLCAGSSDTLVETMLWLMLEMANNPDIQARVQAEIDQVVSDDRLPSYDDRFNLPFTEATTLESGRFHTIVPFSVLHQTSKETEIEGYFIPKDCMIIPNLTSVHMDPEVWGDPENFRPERFLDKDKKIIGRENVIPFSIGKRSCIGEVLARQEVFVYFASLLQQFYIRPPEGVESIVVKCTSTIVVGMTPFEIRFIPRKKK